MQTAGPAEILRAVHKDNIFLEKCHQDIQVVAENVLGQGNFLKWRRLIKTLSTGLYYSITNLSGLQTLGEEYAGLIVVDPTQRNIPSRQRLAVMIISLMWGRTVLEKLLTHLRETVQEVHRKRTENSGSNNSGILGKATVATGQLIQGIKQSLPLLLRIHLVIFYLQGRFHHVSKRVVGIHYILVRKWFANQNENSQRNLKYLRLMSVVNLVLTAVHDTVVFLNSQPTAAKKLAKTEVDDSTGADPLRKCSLCLEIRTNSSVTPCGHLFCWECIMDWLQTKEECPICRTEVTCSRVVPLQNHV